MRWLSIGMAIAIAASTAVAIDDSWHDARRPAIIAALLLMAIGYVRVAMRLSGWRRGMLWSIAALQLAWLSWVVVRPHVGELTDVQYRAVALTWWSGIALLTIAARAWWRPATPWVVTAAVLAVVLEMPWLGGDLLEALDPWDRPIRELLVSAAIVVMVRSIQRTA